jgi:hypothetical protein
VAPFAHIPVPPLLDALRAQGIDPAAAGLDRDILGALRDTRTREPTGPVTQPVQPQAHRQARKARLNERSRVLAARICAATGLPPAGRKLAATGVGGAANDLAAVIIMVNQAVNAFLEIPPRSRREPSSEELERALSELDAIGDTVQAEVARRVAA